MTTNLLTDKLVSRDCTERAKVQVRRSVCFKEGRLKDTGRENDLVIRRRKVGIDG